MSIELDKAVVCVISLISFLWMWFSFCLPLVRIRIRGLWKLLDGRDWLWGKLGLVLIGGAMLSSVQLLSHVWLFAAPWTAARQASLFFIISRSLLKLKSIELVMSSNHLILCHPFLLPPSIFPSIRVFSNKSILCVRWPKYWSFSFSLSPSNKYSGLISFRIDLFESPCSPGDSEESSPAPQFKSINSSMLSLLYDPTLTSIYDYWKNHNFD